MTNAHFTELGQYRDLEAINAYRQRVEEARCQSPESMMAALALIGRDNSRTPMQWDSSRYAGFTPADAATEPWIGVNPNHVEINAAEEFDDPESVYGFYKKLIAMRHDNATVATGEWNLLAADDEQVYAFTRTSGDVRFLLSSTSPIDPPACREKWRSCSAMASRNRRYCSAPMMPYMA
mgnify:CR=1 FL=1